MARPPRRRSPSRRLERLAQGGEGCRVEKLGSCPRSRRGRTGRRGLPAPAWTTCPGSGPETGRFLSAGRSTSPSPRSGALEGGDGASWAPYGLSRQGSGGVRGRSRPRHDPLEVGGHACADDAAQRVERPAAATALDDPKAGTRSLGSPTSSGVPVRDQDGFRSSRAVRNAVLPPGVANRSLTREDALQQCFGRRRPRRTAGGDRQVVTNADRKRSGRTRTC